MNNYSSGLVSIITPLYNGKNYIVSTMESVIDQTYENWEMIIVDDGSTDGSKELVEGFLSNRKESRIKLFENPSNLGISATRNSGLEKAKGQYICFLDSDDLWDQNKIEKELSFLQEVRKKDTKAAFVYCGCRIIDEKGIPTGQVRSVKKEVTYEVLLKDNVIPCLSVLIDRNIIPTDLCKMPSIVHEDYATWLNLLKEGYIAYGLNESLCSYRVVNTSRSGNKKRAAAWHYIVLKSQDLSFVKRMYLMVCYVIAAIGKRI